MPCCSEEGAAMGAITRGCAAITEGRPRAPPAVAVVVVVVETKSREASDFFLGAIWLFACDRFYNV
jgi:hypothetical protein